MSGRQTIVYQGQTIRVETVTELNTKRPDGMDCILRDGAGRYYWQREQEVHGAQPHSRLHRISLNVVILFQVAVGAADVLRQDTARALAARKEAA